MSSRSDSLLRVLLWWTALVAGILVWLPLVRGATQGSAYSWALAKGIGGRGVGGTYWMLVIAIAFVLCLLYLGWRGAALPFHWMLLAFHMILAAAAIHAAVSDPNALRLEGATAGIDVSLAVVGPLLFGGFAAAALFWVIRDLRSRIHRTTLPWTWTGRARVRLVLFCVLIPIEVALFRSGGLRSPQNLIGLGIVFWQWLLLNRVLAERRHYRP